MSKSLTKSKRVLTKRMFAAIPDMPTPATVQITFIGGVGQATISLFRNLALINLQMLTNDGAITFPHVEIEDGISVNGVSTGSGANISIDRQTSPSPTPFDTNMFHGGYIVIS